DRQPLPPVLRLQMHPELQHLSMRPQPATPDELPTVPQEHRPILHAMLPLERNLLRQPPPRIQRPANQRRHPRITPKGECEVFVFGLPRSEDQPICIPRKTHDLATITPVMARAPV